MQRAYVFRFKPNVWLDARFCTSRERAHMKKLSRGSRYARGQRFLRELEGHLKVVAKECKVPGRKRTHVRTSEVIPILRAAEKLLTFLIRRKTPISMTTWLAGYLKGDERYRSATFTLREDIREEEISWSEGNVEGINCLIAIKRGQLGIRASNHTKALGRTLYDRDRTAEALHAALHAVEFSELQAMLLGVPSRKYRFNSLKRLCEIFTTPHQQLIS